MYTYIRQTKPDNGFEECLNSEIGSYLLTQHAVVIADFFIFNCQRGSPALMLPL